MADKVQSNILATNWKGKSIGEMWTFIESILTSYTTMPRRKDLTNQQICELYSKLVQVDDIFRELTQISILKQDIKELKKKLKS
ncbi:MAG: hypothetical protein KGI28_07730 [Thaumarchaeota archaeon]|nr:hypothetical protein [Nitrososphaerota archaeon]